MRHLLFHGALLEHGERGDVQVVRVYVGADRLQDGARIGRGLRVRGVELGLGGCHGRVEGILRAEERLVGLDYDGARGFEPLGHVDGRLVHMQLMPRRCGHRVHVIQSEGAHYPIAPSISSLMRLFISTAYSRGSSFETGSAKPFTIIVRASSSGMPRLIR